MRQISTKNHSSQLDANAVKQEVYQATLRNWAQDLLRSGGCLRDSRFSDLLGIIEKVKVLNSLYINLIF